MSDHFNSFLMNDVLIRLEEQSFFADIGEEGTLCFVQDALALSRHHDGNPGEALAGVGQRLGICYYCWDRGTDLRQGICSDCRAADSIEIDSEEAETSPREAAVSYGFISPETIRDLLGFLPEKLTRDLDVWNVQELPGNCIDRHLREIHVDSAWRPTGSGLVEPQDRRRQYWESPTATLICTGHATILPAEAPKDHHGERAADHAT